MRDHNSSVAGGSVERSIGGGFVAATVTDITLADRRCSSSMESQSANSETKTSGFSSARRCETTKASFDGEASIDAVT